jgi:hypothetical protein
MNRPVTFPPGRARLLTRPLLTGSRSTVIKIGMVLVAADGGERRGRSGGHDDVGLFVVRGPTPGRVTARVDPKSVVRRRNRGLRSSRACASSSMNSGGARLGFAPSLRMAIRFGLPSRCAGVAHGAATATMPAAQSSVRRFTASNPRDRRSPPCKKRWSRKATCLQSLSDTHRGFGSACVRPAFKATVSGLGCGRSLAESGQIAATPKPNRLKRRAVAQGM